MGDETHRGTEIPAGGLGLSQETVGMLMALVVEASGQGKRIAEGVAVLIDLAVHPVEGMLLFQERDTPEVRERLAKEVAGRPTASAWMSTALVERAIKRQKLDERALSFVRTAPRAGRFRYALFSGSRGTVLGTWAMPE
jgi:ATP/maltotriose-dependent transcriptional regulator MalT